MVANDHVMTLYKQLAALEVSVATGFLEQRQRLDKVDGRLDRIDGRLNEHTSRFDRLEDRVSALDSKLDVVAESIRGDVTTIRELVTGFMDEMRRTTGSMREQHEADRRLTRLALFDQVTRIRALEVTRHSGIGSPTAGVAYKSGFVVGGTAQATESESSSSLDPQDPPFDLGKAPLRRIQWRHQRRCQAAVEVGGAHPLGHHPRIMLVGGASFGWRVMPIP